MKRKSQRRLAVLPVLVLMAAVIPVAQAAAPMRPEPSKPAAAMPTPRAAAMIDLTGYWVSVVTEDWAWRMLVAKKGDFGSLPVNNEGIKAGANWDPVADKAAGEACRTYGAAGIIRQPGRLHITWQDERTLRVDFSAGTQTRLLSFDPASGQGNAEHTWAGRSVAQWTKVLNWQEFSPPTVAPVGGTLKVVTTNMRSGYLQSNGFPYSDDAKMTEYFDRINHNGQAWLIVTTVIQDPRYLRDTLYWSTQFKLEPDGSKWQPKPCDALQVSSAG